MLAVPQRLSASVEDYLQAIYAVGERVAGEVTTTAVAGRLRVTPSSVSGMVRKLQQSGLVEHLPYRGVALTESGRRAVLRVLRRRRVIESFLVAHLGMPWDEVDSEADRLEHAVSDHLVELIAEKLGQPTRDPHGDPIPTRDGRILSPVVQTLASLAPGTRGSLARIWDAEPEMLRYLTEKRIRLGDHVEVLERQPFGGSVVVRVGQPPSGAVHSLGAALAGTLSIEVEPC